MQDNSDRTGIYLVAGLLMGSLIMAVGYGLPQWDWSADRWLGDKPVLEYMLQGATIAAAIVAAVAALQTFRMNLDAGYADRFQTGVSLLAGNSGAAAAGGLEILSDIARVRPGLYHERVTRVIAVHVTEISTVGWTEVLKGEWQGYDHANQPTVGAFRAIATWIKVLEHAKQYSRQDARIWRAYLHLVRFDDQTFRGMTFVTMAVGAACFRKCTFIDCEFQGLVVAELLEFEECSFNNTAITTVGTKTPMEFRQSSFDGLAINGNPITTNGMF